MPSSNASARNLQYPLAKSKNPGFSPFQFSPFRIPREEVVSDYRYWRYAISVRCRKRTMRCLYALNPIGAIQAPLAKGFLVRYPEDLRQNAQKFLSVCGWGLAPLDPSHTHFRKPFRFWLCRIRRCFRKGPINNYYETTAQIRSRRVDRSAHPPSFPSRWMRFAYPPYAGTFFICWGDETLNMIVRSLTLMKRVPITLENETTTPVGRVELRVTRQKCIKKVGLRRLRA
uniref:Uncharacterized protein n=1 Tax=Candidatus Kentrum sp. LPFa TaxID=2126335 RepID=A0A450W949_9GAMM|nr:MAG: hypothetical protein BECKLPF1236B_GA0070989_104919 [Candidatus Kentron sp. LPFa]